MLGSIVMRTTKAGVRRYSLVLSDPSSGKQRWRTYATKKDAEKVREAFEDAMARQFATGAPMYLSREAGPVQVAPGLLSLARVGDAGAGRPLRTAGGVSVMAEHPVLVAARARRTAVIVQGDATVRRLLPDVKQAVRSAQRSLDAFHGELAALDAGEPLLAGYFSDRSPRFLIDQLAAWVQYVEAGLTPSPR